MCKGKDGQAAAVNPMKKTLIVALVAASFGLSASALAQTAGPAGLPPQSPVAGKAHGKAGKGGHMSKAEMERINAVVLDKLGLTADQKAKIMAHQKESEEKLIALKKANKGASPTDKEAAKEKAKAIRKDNQAFMKTILDKKQMKEMAKLRREEIAKAKAPEAPTTPAKP